MAHIFMQRGTLSRFALLFGSLVWYYMIITLKDCLFEALVQPQSLVIDVVYFGAIIGASLLGTIIVRRVRRHVFLFIWLILGVMTSFLTLAFHDLSYEQLVLAFSLLGISFGLGMPSCLTFFINQISIDRRGQVGGLTFLATSIAVVPIGPIFQNIDSRFCSMILIGWRFFTLLVFYVIHDRGPSLKKRPEGPPEHSSFTSVFRARAFTLYFAAWLIFGLIDSFETLIIRNSVEASLFSSATIVFGITSAFSVFVSGVLADRIGRKKIVIFGFVALGLAYATIGFAEGAGANGFSRFWPLYSFIDGVAGGIFMITFVILIWGDISTQQHTEKYYALGNIPFFAARIVGTPLTPYLGSLDIFMAFSLAALFLFLATLPVMFAPETLPEEIMEKRRLRMYLERAKEAKEKHG